MIKYLEQDELYKYLVVDESNEVQHAVIKKKKKKEKSGRVLPESTSNAKDRTQLCKTHRCNKYFGNTCCNV